MKIVIAGASGLVGQVLVGYFKSQQHEVITLSRNPRKGMVYWNPAKGELDRQSIEAVDIIINLAGEEISKRWSSSYKRRIKESRVNSTRFLVDNILLLKQKPKIFINASAIGFYGNGSMEEHKDENSSRGSGFLADVCEAWEEQSKAIASGYKVRVLQLRFGVILSAKSGALAKMLPVFKMGIGGCLGNGHQPLSWVSVDEIPSIIDFLIKEESIFGPVNVVAPSAITNEDFTRALCDVLRKPVFFPVPSFMIKLLFGEMGDQLLLNGVNVFPNILVKHGYTFKHPHLKETLIYLLKKQ